MSRPLGLCEIHVFKTFPLSCLTTESVKVEEMGLREVGPKIWTTN